MNSYSPQVIAQAIHDIYGNGKNLSSLPLEKCSTFIDMLGVSMNRDDFLEYEKRIIEKTHITSKSQKLVLAWKKKVQSNQHLNEQQAADFVDEWLSCFGTSELYNHDFLAGTARRPLQGTMSQNSLYSPSAIPCWVLHCTIDGTARFHKDGITHEIQRGEFALFKPGSSYRYELDPNCPDKQHVWIMFQPRPHWGTWLNWNSLDKSSLNFSLSDENQITTIQTMLLELLDISLRNNTYKNEFLYNHFEKILIQMNEYQATEIQCDNRIKKACEYIQKNLTNKISVDDVAKYSNISSSWLAHLFKDHMGVSIKHWHNEIRLQEAQKQLTRSNLSISSIAKKLGYEDPAVFTKSFKKRMNCNPTKYRKRHQLNS